MSYSGLSSCSQALVALEDRSCREEERAAGFHTQTHNSVGVGGDEYGFPSTAIKVVHVSVYSQKTDTPEKK